MPLPGKPDFRQKFGIHLIDVHHPGQKSKIFSCDKIVDISVAPWSSTCLFLSSVDKKQTLSIDGGILSNKYTTNWFPMLRWNNDARGDVCSFSIFETMNFFSSALLCSRFRSAHRPFDANRENPNTSSSSSRDAG